LPSPGSVRRGVRGALAQLLHALNQPLTGLQCSMEVALASPRTLEQYAQGLRDGLGLTERMRALVEAIREVVDGEEENEVEKAKEKNKETNKEKINKDDPETTDLRIVLGEVVEDLGPVAEAKRVRITLDGDGPADLSLLVKTGHRRLSSLVFRTLESALSLAEPGSRVRIQMSAGAIRIAWMGRQRPAEFSRPGLGLLVAEAGWERAGATWERERAGNLETVTLRLAGVSAGSKSS
jgi:signal transduction histidine kinase